ncbi:hypothetical protein [Microbacterium sp.]|uniref:hypothetical protein n=1 Tax=Microbacterium sp. TaxID=51671 RepID=UPI003F9E3759
MTDAVPFPEYPRPQLVRKNYTILNGRWDYAFTAAGIAPGIWDGSILVPFSPEAELSGVGRQLQPHESLWYRRRLDIVAAPGHRTLLHFGAVDQSCRVLIDGVEVAAHVGGYLPFTVDITDALGTSAGTSAEHELVVEVRDVSDTSHHSVGKQRLERGGIWYTAQSGIWQSVWLEDVPDVHITGLRMRTPDARKGMPDASVEITVETSSPSTVAVTISQNGATVAQAEGASGDVLQLQISDPRLWSPEAPPPLRRGGDARG